MTKFADLLLLNKTLNVNKKKEKTVRNKKVLMTPTLKIIRRLSLIPLMKIEDYTDACTQQPLALSGSANYKI